MTFYYFMYGSTVESLSVYVRINGSEERIWSRHGNQLSRNWTKGCVAMNYNGTYQVEPLYGSIIMVTSEKLLKKLMWSILQRQIYSERLIWVTYLTNLVNKCFVT